ncbi:MAG TPA: rod shape-determining protein MreD [Acetobacteraceae bacterium]|nr:rod shape-determining protein MreD [Acetobacteraceae bacterium]
MDDTLPGIRPRPSLWRRLDAAFRHGFPAGATALLLLLLAAPLDLPAQAELQQAVILAAVFFWSLFRPGSMPPPAVFLIGLLSDLLGLAPPGLNAVTLLIVQGLALKWRRKLVRQGFLVVWLAFLAVAAGAAALGWVVTSLLSWHAMPLSAAGFQFLLSACLYPALALPLTRAHRSIAAPERA